MFRVAAARLGTRALQGRGLPVLSTKTTPSQGTNLWNKGPRNVRPQPSITMLQRHRYSTGAKAKYRADSALQSADILENGRLLDVHWTDGVSSQFHSVWLRHNCHCPACRHYDSNQRYLDVTTIPERINISQVRSTDAGDLEITWQEDGHCGVLGQGFLRWARYDDRALTDKYSSTEPLFLKEKPIPEVTYPEVKASENGLYKWLKNIADYGICLLKEVPTTENYIKKVLQLVGPIQETVYGDVFDVKYQRNAINLAYDDVRLNFHMDQVPYESFPGIQYLHCLQFDETVTGGETLFVDMFDVAEEFREKYPEKFKTFLEIPATFERIHEDRYIYIQCQRPHIKINRLNQIVEVRWHSSNEGPLQVPHADVERYYEAYATFARMIVDWPLRKSIRLQSGDMICFNNRRMSHGRNAFHQTGVGVRHLQGAYTNIDDFKSMVQSLAFKVGDGKLVRKVGNGSLM